MFEAFRWLLHEGKFDKVLKLATDIVKLRDEDDDGVIWYVCAYAPDVDESVQLIHKLVALGAALEIKPKTSFYSRRNPIHVVCWKEKPKLLHTLIELGSPIELRCGNGWTALHHAISVQSVECVKILLDAGAQLSLCVSNFVPTWVTTLAEKRTRIRNVSIVLLGMIKISSTSLCGNGRDVLRMIARCVWSMRALKD